MFFGKQSLSTEAVNFALNDNTLLEVGAHPLS